MPDAPPPADDALPALLDAAVALHGIPMDPAWRAEALNNLRGIAAAARFVLAHPLEDEADLAPVFRA